MSASDDQKKRTILIPEAYTDAGALAMKTSGTRAIINDFFLGIKNTVSAAQTNTVMGGNTNTLTIGLANTIFVGVKLEASISWSTTFSIAGKKDFSLTNRHQYDASVKYTKAKESIDVLAQDITAGKVSVTAISQTDKVGSKSTTALTDYTVKAAANVSLASGPASLSISPFVAELLATRVAIQGAKLNVGTEETVSLTLSAAAINIKSQATASLEGGALLSVNAEGLVKIG